MALGNLLEIYRKPLTEYLVHNRMLSRTEADDAFQDFIAEKVLEKGILSKFSRDVGKFRTFLLVSLRNHAEDCRRRRREIPANDRAFEDIPRIPDIDAFHIEFAVNVVGEVLSRLKRWYENRNRPEVWELFNRMVVIPARETVPAPEYKTVLQQMQLASTSEAYNLLANAKRTANRILHNVVGEYETCNIDLEISEIHKILLDSSTGLGELLSDIQDRVDLGQILTDCLEQEPEPQTGITVWQLFNDPDPKLLETLKQKSRTEYTHRPIAEIIYYCAIAVARVKCNKNISSLSRDNLIRGLDTILARPYIPEKLRQLLQKVRNDIVHKDSI